MPKAALIFADKTLLPDGGIVEMKIWRLPHPDAERPHGLKYRLFYGVAGRRVVGYDNERGKGDHRHIGEREEPYAFVDVRTLVRDFLADVDQARRSR
jgi:hypothetical protein